MPLDAGLVSFHPASRPRGTLPSSVLALGADRPLVYTTLGTVFNNPAYELPLFPAVLEGLRNSVDIVLTVGPNVDPASLGPQPSSVHVARYLPQRAVLERASVVICHGGYGTLLDAIDAAVPLLLAPFGADQYINAASVERASIGIVLAEEAVTATTIAEAVSTLIKDPDWRNRISNLSSEWRSLPGPAAACDALRALARGSRPK